MAEKTAAERERAVAEKERAEQRERKQTRSTSGGFGGAGSPADSLREEQELAKQSAKDSKRKHSEKRKRKSGGTDFPGIRGYQAVNAKGRDAPGDSGDDDGVIPDDTPGKRYFPEGARVLAEPPAASGQERTLDMEEDDEEGDEE